MRCAELLRAFEREARDPTARLFVAIQAGDSKAVEQSLVDGASLEGWDTARGWTPLSMVVFLGRERIARLLLEKGAKARTRNRDKGTTLHGAALMGRVSLVELLIEHKAEFDARDGTGSTPLHAAAFLGRVETAECLLRNRADPTLQDASGRTALDVTRTDRKTTELVIRLMGLEIDRAQLETNRVEVAKLLGG